MADGIDGKPGVMTSVFGPGGWFQGYATNAAVNARSGKEEPGKETYGASQMMEGQAFYVKDGPATQNLVNFMHRTDVGFDGYRNRAHDDGYSYLTADADGATFIEDVARNVVRGRDA